MPRDTTVGWEVDESGICVTSPLGEICECSSGDERIAPTFTVEEMERHARLSAASPELLAACKEQHEAIDWLLARLTERAPEFMPSASPAWPALLQGNAAIDKAEGRV